MIRLEAMALQATRAVGLVAVIAEAVQMEVTAAREGRLAAMMAVMEVMEVSRTAVYLFTYRHITLHLTYLTHWRHFANDHVFLKRTSSP